MISFWAYKRYNLPHVNNVLFSENKFDLLFLHNTGNNYRDQKEYTMKQWSVPNKYTSLGLKNSASILNSIAIHYLHFALISVGKEIFNNFQIKF